VKFFSATVIKSQALASLQNKRISSKSPISPHAAKLPYTETSIEIYQLTHHKAMFPSLLSSSGTRATMLWVEHL